MAGADRVRRRVILRGRRVPIPLPSAPQCVRHTVAAPVERNAHSTHHARGRAARFPPVLPRIGEYSRSTRAAPPPTALQPSRRVATAASHGAPEYRPRRCCHCLPAPCQRPERRTTHARSFKHANAARSAPDRTVPLTERRRQGALQFGELGHAADPAPDRAGELVLVKQTATHPPKRERNAERRRAGAARPHPPRARERDLQIRQVGQPAELWRERPAQLI